MWNPHEICHVRGQEDSSGIKVPAPKRTTQVLSVEAHNGRERTDCIRHLLSPHLHGGTYPKWINLITKFKQSL